MKLIRSQIKEAKRLWKNSRIWVEKELATSEEEMEMWREAKEAVAEKERRVQERLVQVDEAEKATDEELGQMARMAEEPTEWAEFLAHREQKRVEKEQLLEMGYLQRYELEKERHKDRRWGITGRRRLAGGADAMEEEESVLSSPVSFSPSLHSAALADPSPPAFAFAPAPSLINESPLYSLSPSLQQNSMHAQLSQFPADLLVGGIDSFLGKQQNRTKELPAENDEEYQPMCEASAEPNNWGNVALTSDALGQFGASIEQTGSWKGKEQEKEQEKEIDEADIPSPPCSPPPSALPKWDDDVWHAGTVASAFESDVSSSAHSTVGLQMTTGELSSACSMLPAKCEDRLYPPSHDQQRLAENASWQQTSSSAWLSGSCTESYGLLPCFGEEGAHWRSDALAKQTRAHRMYASPVTFKGVPKPKPDVPFEPVFKPGWNSCTEQTARFRLVETNCVSAGIIEKNRNRTAPWPMETQRAFNVSESSEWKTAFLSSASSEAASGDMEDKMNTSHRFYWDNALFCSTASCNSKKAEISSEDELDQNVVIESKGEGKSYVSSTASITPTELKAGKHLPEASVFEDSITLDSSSYHSKCTGLLGHNFWESPFLQRVDACTNRKSGESSTTQKTALLELPFLSNDGLAIEKRCNCCAVGAKNKEQKGRKESETEKDAHKQWSCDEREAETDSSESDWSSDGLEGKLRKKSQLSGTPTYNVEGECLEEVGRRGRMVARWRDSDAEYERQKQQNEEWWRAANDTSAASSIGIGVGGGRVEEEEKRQLMREEKLERKRRKRIRKEIKEAKEHWKRFGVWVRKAWVEEEEEAKMWSDAEARLEEKEAQQALERTLVECQTEEELSSKLLGVEDAEKHKTNNMLVDREAEGGILSSNDVNEGKGKAVDFSEESEYARSIFDSRQSVDFANPFCSNAAEIEKEEEEEEEEEGSDKKHEGNQRIGETFHFPNPKQDFLCGKDESEMGNSRALTDHLHQAGVSVMPLRNACCCVAQPNGQLHLVDGAAQNSIAGASAIPETCSFPAAVLCLCEGDAERVILSESTAFCNQPASASAEGEEIKRYPPSDNAELNKILSRIQAAGIHVRPQKLPPLLPAPQICSIPPLKQTATQLQ
eukprot:MONOS_7642.1-p1 / transcript=MONOS_7642.1 / gene=MONOS_7642 / organism=Monocercomonoides_exilis_PA203 / gene_product=unspecified product / transcript_product=unspecified product / location=Mono_scaffold00266:70796-74394(-) / protein_length=1117 / sequence_SO=supercontig / SO=protein_coding / is_pseudo=false